MNREREGCIDERVCVSFVGLMALFGGDVISYVTSFGIYKESI